MCGYFCYLTLECNYWVWHTFDDNDQDCILKSTVGSVVEDSRVILGDRNCYG